MPSVCFTGRATPAGDFIVRSELEDMAQARGWVLHACVGFGTTFLVASQEHTSKANAARELGVTVISYDLFCAALWLQDPSPNGPPLRRQWELLAIGNLEARRIATAADESRGGHTYRRENDRSRRPVSNRPQPRLIPGGASLEFPSSTTIQVRARDVERCVPHGFIKSEYQSCLAQAQAEASRNSRRRPINLDDD